MSNDAVQMILDGAGRQPIPTKSEQLHLARLVQQGLAPDATPKQRRAGDRARQRLVAGNARLAVNIARRYRARIPGGSVFGFEDLIQEGMIGLDAAARKFDPARGFSFSTYASWWIMQACGRALQMQSRTIRLTPTVLDLCRRWRHKSPEMTLEQFAQEFGYEQDHVVWALQQEAMTRTTSLDKTSRTSGDDSTPLADLLAAEGIDPLEHFDHQLAVEQLEAILPEELALVEQQAVLNRRTIDMAQEMELSRSAVLKRLDLARSRLAQVAGIDAYRLVA